MDFNGTLIIYAHGYVKPQEPLALPEEFGEADVRELIEQLLNLGFGVATSSYHKNGYAIEQAEADLNDLVAHVESIEPDVDAIFVIGGSEGALITTMLVEKYPETYAGGLALCGPLAGTSYQVAYLADVRVLFDYFYPGVFLFGALECRTMLPPNGKARTGTRTRSLRRSKPIPMRSPRCSMLRAWPAIWPTTRRLRTAPRTCSRTACSERTICWTRPEAGR